MQQGQVDWVAFGNTIWTASSAVLQRFGAAGIQPITYGAGLVLSNQMHLDRVGQSRMENAVASLQVSSSWDKLLWFGFGYQSFVGTMAESLAGIKCLAICACLVESHSEELAAWVLSELWRISNFPEEYEPSHSQFLALIKASAGVVSGTGFSKTLDTMLGDQLWREPSGSHYTEFLVREMEDGVLEASNAKDIANALHGLFKISRGDADHMVVTGGSECAFISAVAHWLLNLRVSVRNCDGRVIFDDARKGPARQVVIQYGAATNEPLQVTGTTYVLGNCREVFGRIPDHDEYHLVVRTPWSCCLTRVFGTRFKALSKMPYVLGDYLGGVARIHRAVATGENNIGNLSRFHYVDYAETSYGLGFVNTVASTFPELNNIDGLYDRMQHSVNVTFDEAIRNVEQSILSLEALCTCDYCTSGQEETTIWPENSRVCLVGIAYAIRRIAMVMSCVVQDFGSSELHPVVKGIYEFSALGKKPESPISRAKETMADYHEDKETVQVNGTWKRPEFYWNALGLRHQQGRLMEFDHHPLESVCLLLQGPLPKSEGMSLSDRQPFTAISRQGICCYMEILRDLNCQAERLCRVHVLAGQIHCKNRRYDFVRDGDILRSQVGGAADLGSAVLLEPSTSIPQVRQCPETTKVEALATERGSESAISFVYRVTISNTSIYLGPGKLTKTVLESTGLIACKGQGCKSTLAIPSHHVHEGWTIASNSPSLRHQAGVACCIWTYQDDIARSLAMIIHMKRHGLRSQAHGQFVFLRRHECFPCSTRSVLESSGRLMDRRIADEAGQRHIVVHVI